MKLLLIDDDSFLRDMYATKFTEAGHEVAVAENGTQGLAMLEKDTVDAVLLDMVMPVMTGLELLGHLSQLPSFSTMKCIVLSNQGEESDKKAAEAAGATGYIVKAEAIPSEVVTKVEALCAK